MSKLLLIEVGNSFIHWTIFSNNGFTQKENLRHGEVSELPFKEVNEVILICPIKEIKEELLKSIKIHDLNYSEITLDSQKFIKNTYPTLGIDRVCNLIGAVQTSGSEYYVVFDFGTATTVSTCSNEGDFIGGLIKAGIKTELISLHKNTRTLPEVRTADIKDINIISRNTEEAILNGVLFSQISFCKNYLTELEKKLSLKAKVFITGGNAELISKLFNEYDSYDPLLTLKGIYYASTTLCKTC